MELRTFDPSTADDGTMKFVHNLEVGELIAVKGRGTTSWEVRLVTGKVKGIDRDWEPADDIQGTKLHLYAWNQNPVMGGRRSRMDPNEMVFSFGIVDSPKTAKDRLTGAKAYDKWEFALDEKPKKDKEDKS
jgi:hypothetical protein